MWDSAVQMPTGCHIYFQYATLIRCQQIWTVHYAAKLKEERTYFLLYVKSIIIPQTHTHSCKIKCYTTSRIPYLHIKIRRCFMTPGYIKLVTHWHDFHPSKYFHPHKVLSHEKKLMFLQLTHWHTTFYNTWRTYIYIWSAYSWCF